MYVVCTFRYGFDVELAIADLEQNGFTKKQIMAIPLRPLGRSGNLLHVLPQEGTHLFDFSMVFGTIFMLLGVIYGNALVLGPILWGLIGLLVGIFSGFVVTLIRHRKDRLYKLRGISHQQIVLLIRVEQQRDVPLVERLIRNYSPTGAARLWDEAGMN